MEFFQVDFWHIVLVRVDSKESQTGLVGDNPIENLRILEI